MSQLSQQPGLILTSMFDMIKVMRISIHTPDYRAANHGYGVALDGIIRSLKALGHTVLHDDASAPVELAFSQPFLWDWSSKDSYKIGYVPWESTRLPDNWIQPMLGADEIWTTSPWCKLVFEKHGFTDVRVFQHGIDTTGDEGWTRKRRRAEGRPIRFLHIGEPAPRKGGQLVYDTFKTAFGDDSSKATLTIKAHGHNTIRGLDTITVAGDGGLYITPTPDRSNVKLITDSMSTYELIDLVRRHDVLVYPSYGEGFGLIPLQAMATGMPVICPKVWAPYGHLLLPRLTLGTKLIPSPWPDIHSGNMYEPNAYDLRETMELCADRDEFTQLSIHAYARSFHVEKEYDWNTLTASAFEHIFENFS